jgi:hypothetical protein
VRLVLVNSLLAMELVLMWATMMSTMAAALAALLVASLPLR